MQFKQVLEVAQKLLFRHFKCDLLIADWLAEPYFELYFSLI